MVDSTIRIKRRTTGEPGPPDSLVSSELAYNEVDNVLYYGKGDDGGKATEVVAIGGAAALSEIAEMWLVIERVTEKLDDLSERLASLKYQKKE